VKSCGSWWFCALLVLLEWPFFPHYSRIYSSYDFVDKGVLNVLGGVLPKWNHKICLTRNCWNRALFTSPKNFSCFLNCCYCTDCAQNLPGPGLNIRLTLFRFHPNRLTFGVVIAECTNTIFLPRRVFPWFVRSAASLRANKNCSLYTLSMAMDRKLQNHKKGNINHTTIYLRALRSWQNGQLGSLGHGTETKKLRKT